MSQRNTELETVLRSQVADLQAQLAAERQHLSAAQEAAAGQVAAERSERAQLERRVAEMSAALAQRDGQVRCSAVRCWIAVKANK